MKKKVALLILSAGLSLVVVELVLRLLEPPRYPGVRSSGYYIQSSEVLGWEGRPGARGFFSSGHCFGRVDLDGDGLRLNGGDETRREEFSNILFLGDSNTAGFEVDNDQTVPALLEQGLRVRGFEVNVINLGVRGYGTDQSVRRALRLSEELEPEQIVYMFTDNDFFDNNILRTIYRRFGKSVYWRIGRDFEILNDPVPEYEKGYFGAVVLDRQGSPVIYDGVSRSTRTVGPLRVKARSWRLFRWVDDTWGNPFDRKFRRWSEKRADPFEVMNSPRARVEDVFLALYFGLIDGGRLRVDHRNYYDAQFEFLLEQLWSIPSVRRIHLVEFPSEPTMELLADGENSINIRLFADLVDKDVVQDFVSLSETMHNQGIDPEVFSCEGGDHFTDNGDRWIAEVLLQSLDFNFQTGDPPSNNE